nr:HEAT repeat domain-containing protein [Klebsiella variicola]
KCASSFTLGQAEVSGLILSGIDNYDSHNTPLWKWINESKVSIENYTLLTKDERKRKAIDIMRFIAHDIKKDREIYLNDWLIDESNENVKVSALKYIGDVGTLNDIPLIIKEYERNEVRTSSSAIEAIISISFRHGVIKGFDAILEYQPNSISSKMLDALKEKEILLESEKLFEGLNVKNKEVREFCISSLIRRSAINECQLEELLKHDDYDVRYIVINTLSSINYKLYKEKARDVLIKNTGEDKDSIYKKYVKHNLFRESNENLFDLGKTPYIFDANHIIALAKKDNKNIPRVREIVSDNAEVFISDLLNNIPEKNRAEIVKFFNEHGGFVKDNITFDCVELICETMKKEDLNLIRGYLRSKGSSLSNVIMNFFKKYGDFDDVYNLCNARMKENGTLLGAHSIGQYKNKILADTVLFLSKGKESELLEINMPDMLKINIVSQMNPNGFKEIPHHKIFELLNKENALLRERVCLKVVESMTKDQISMILSDYSKQITYYYNVIHWLDFGVNFNKAISRKAIKKYLYA